MSVDDTNVIAANWQRLYPFSPHWHHVDRGRLHYLDEGLSLPETPTLLFVHGNPTWSFHWRRLITDLRGGFRCVAPDHLGCGQSDRPDVDLRLSDHIEHLSSLINELDLHNITLVAQDWGGAIGLGALLRQPARLERIILFNTGAFPPRYIPWRIRACRIPLLGRLAVQGLGVFNRAALRMTLSRTPSLDPAVAAGYMAPYDRWSRRRGVYGFIKDIPTSPRHPTWRLLSDVERGLPSLADRPILLVWGADDWCFRFDCLDRFLESWPRAETRRMPNVGHWVVEDAPQESLEAVREFVATRRAEVPSIHRS